MGREMRTQTKASLTTFIDISDHISGRFQHGYIMVRELGSGEPLNCWAKLGVDPGTAKRACRGRTGAVWDARRLSCPTGEERWTRLSNAARANHARHKTHDIIGLMV
jgi:hypothetical protein